MEAEQTRARVEAGLNRAVYSHHLRDLLQSLEIGCVIDVGAHHGEFGNLLRGIGFAGSIASFEPVRQTFEELAATCAEDPDWSAFHMALGDREGRSRINVTRGSDLCSFRRPTGDATAEIPRLAVERQEQVEVRTLDAMFDACVGPRTGKRTFLKLDTQGWELPVLRGAGGCLPRVAGLQVEVPIKPIYEGSPAYDEVVRFLNERGFELTGIFPVTRDERLRIIEVDCLMTGAAGLRG